MFLTAPNAALEAHTLASAEFQRVSNTLASSRHNVYNLILLPPQAFACFASALNLEPHHPETLSACGTLYKSCGLLVEAVESYKLALCVTPSDGALRESLAIALTDLGTDLTSVRSHDHN